MNFKQGLLIAFFVCAYILFNALWLIPFWVDHWNTDLSWIAFIIWCIPLIFIQNFPNQYLLVAGLLLSLFGTIGDLKIAQSYALALAIGSFYPWGLLTAIWLICAIAWSPSFSWIASQFNSNFQLARIVIVAIPVIALLYQSYKDGSEA